MNLQGKKLLVLTGCNGASDIIEYAKSKGVFVIATDYHDHSIVKQKANKAYNISTTDIDKLLELCIKYKVDGITTGTSESSMYSVLKLTNLLKLPFYTNANQLEIINDKKKFKDLLRRHEVGVTPEFVNLDEVEFPVIVKPVDSSGGKGISICRNSSELKKAREYALKFSRKNEYIVEKYIEGFQEVFINYTVVNGNFSISCTFDNFKNRGRRLDIHYQDVNIYPSIYTKTFLDKCNNNLINAFKDVGVMNGVISVQAFYSDGEFYIYEAGFRLGGSQSYIFSKKNNDISHLEMMINYSLTGEMEDENNYLDKDSWKFRYKCCQINIPINHGVIAKIEGLDEVETWPQVINVTRVLSIGDSVKVKGTTSALAARIHLYGDSVEELNETTNRLLEKVLYYDSQGNLLNYNVNKFDYWKYYGK